MNPEKLVKVELTREEAEIAIQGCVNQCTYPGGDARSIIAERAFRKLRAALTPKDPNVGSGFRDEVEKMHRGRYSPR